MDDQLREWMQENMSPQAVAVVAAALRGLPIDDKQAHVEARWFRDELMAVVGGEEAMNDLVAEVDNDE